jgi:hypothetical protein
MAPVTSSTSNKRVVTEVKKTTTPATLKKDFRINLTGNEILLPID